MPSLIEKYRNDLEKLINEGNALQNAMQKECFPEEFETKVKEKLKEKADDFIKKIPSFESEYQNWYSESLSVIKLMLPSRLDDFIRKYEKPKNRKEIKYGNYVIEDYLQGLTVNNGFDTIVDKKAAIPEFQQQLSILKSVQARFDSSLFDIKKLLQADLFDSEIDGAKELLNRGFLRAAGAVAGVILEKHLSSVCDNHELKIAKKDPGINDYNDLLKNNGVIETLEWRSIQRLGDLRNLCDHDKKRGPTEDEVNELIEGTDKKLKTLF